MLCEDLEGWDEDRREACEGGMHIYIHLIHFVVLQKLTQLCKAMIIKNKLIIQFKKIEVKGPGIEWLGGCDGAGISGNLARSFE